MKSIRLMLVAAFLASIWSVECAVQEESAFCCRLGQCKLANGINYHQNQVQEDQSEKSNVSSLQATRRLVAGGYDAQVGEYPAYVGLESSEGYIKGGCGGTLIGARLVLTARHCVLPPKIGKIWREIIAKPGIVGINDPVPAYQVESVCIFVGGGVNEDIALLKLDREVQLDERTKIAYLPDRSLPYGVQAHMIGLGYINLANETATTLQVLPVRRHSCEGYKGVEFCLISDHLGTACPGDSGSGAFVRAEDGTHVVQALVHGGWSDCEPVPQRDAMVFVDVYRFIDWIKLSAIELFKLDEQPGQFHS